jgi:hypothetical protein
MYKTKKDRWDELAFVKWTAVFFLLNATWILGDVYVIHSEGVLKNYS